MIDDPSEETPKEKNARMRLELKQDELAYKKEKLRIKEEQRLEAIAKKQRKRDLDEHILNSRIKHKEEKSITRELRALEISAIKQERADERKVKALRNKPGYVPFADPATAWVPPLYEDIYAYGAANPEWKTKLYTSEEILKLVFKSNDTGQQMKRLLTVAMQKANFVRVQTTRDYTQGYYWKHETKYKLDEQNKENLLKRKHFLEDKEYVKKHGTKNPEIKNRKKTEIVLPKPEAYLKQREVQTQTQEPAYELNFKDIPERFNTFLKNRTPDQLKNGFTVDEAALELKCLPMNISELVKQNPNLERKVKTIVGYYYDIPKAETKKKDAPLSALEVSTYSDLYDLEDLV
jgi:hypothetical protein